MMLATAAAVPAAAQDPGGPPPQANGGWRGGQGHRMGPGRKGEGMLRQALRGITLTDAQKNQLKSINERHRTEMKQFMDAHRPQGQTRPDSAARAAMRQQMMQLRDRHRSELRAILTPQQQATFDKNVAEMRQRGPGMGRPRGDRQHP